MVKIVDMTSALKQVRESISTTGATRKPTSKDDKLYLSNPNEWRRRYELEKTYKDILRTMPASEKNTEAGKIKAMDLARVKSAKNSKNLKLNMKNKGTLKLEDLDKDDEKTIKPIIKQLQKSVAAHDAQAKQLKKDISDEKNLEETKVYRVSHPSKKTAEVEGDNENDAIQRYKRYHKLGSTSGIKATLRKQSPYPSFTSKIPTHQYGGTKGGKPVYIKTDKNLEEQKKELEEQLKTAEKQLEELYIKEDKAYVIRFKRIKDKERMVVVFRNQHDADMYADNIKKQGGQVFSNKLEKIPYKVVDKK